MYDDTAATGTLLLVLAEGRRVDVLSFDLITITIVGSACTKWLLEDDVRLSIHVPDLRSAYFDGQWITQKARVLTLDGQTQTAKLQFLNPDTRLQISIQRHQAEARARELAEAEAAAHLPPVILAQAMNQNEAHAQNSDTTPTPPEFSKNIDKTHQKTIAKLKNTPPVVINTGGIGTPPISPFAQHRPRDPNARSARWPWLVAAGLVGVLGLGIVGQNLLQKGKLHQTIRSARIASASLILTAPSTGQITVDIKHSGDFVLPNQTLAEIAAPNLIENEKNIRIQLNVAEAGRRQNQRALQNILEKLDQESQNNLQTILRLEKQADQLQSTVFAAAKELSLYEGQKTAPLALRTRLLSARNTLNNIENQFEAAHRAMALGNVFAEKTHTANQTQLDNLLKTSLDLRREAMAQQQRLLSLGQVNRGLRLSSPWHARVQRIWVKNGATIRAGQPIVELARIDQPLVDAWLTAAEANQLKKGGKAVVCVPALQRCHDAQIERVEKYTNTEDWITARLFRAANEDRVWVARLRLREPQAKLHGLIANQEATVHFQTLPVPLGLLHWHAMRWHPQTTPSNQTLLAGLKHPLRLDTRLHVRPIN